MNKIIITSDANLIDSGQNFLLMEVGLIGLNGVIAKVIVKTQEKELVKSRVHFLEEQAVQGFLKKKQLTCVMEMNAAQVTTRMHFQL